MQDYTWVITLRVELKGFILSWSLLSTTHVGQVRVGTIPKRGSKLNSLICPRSKA